MTGTPRTGERCACERPLLQQSLLLSSLLLRILLLLSRLLYCPPVTTLDNVILLSSGAGATMLLGVVVWPFLDGFTRLVAGASWMMWRDVPDDRTSGEVR